MKRNPPLEGWREIKLKEVCREITVGHVGPMAGEYVDDGIPFLRSQNIQPFRLDLSGLKYITPEFHQRLRKSSIAPGHVVVVRTGYPGTACVIPKRMTVANCADLVIVRPSPELDPWFLASAFNSTWGRRTVAGKLVGVAQQHFNIGAAREMLMRLPPVEVQRRIAAILSTHDELIENNARRIKIVEEMAQAIYREWFVHFRFPGHKQVNLVPSPLGPIPEGWSIARLSEVAAVNELSIRRGEEPEEIVYVDIASVSPGSINEKKRMKFGDAPGRARRIVRHGDTIWSMVRPNRNSFSLILDPEPNLIVSTGFAVLSATKVPFSYLYHAVTTEDFAGHLANRATGAAYPAVKGEDFEAAQVLRPNTVLLEHFHALAAPMLEMREGLARKNRNLRRTRDLLLPKLISGELDVSKMVAAGERGGESG